MTKQSKSKSAATKKAWAKARQLAEKRGIPVKAARTMLAQNPNALAELTDHKSAKRDTDSDKQKQTASKTLKPVDLSAAEKQLKIKYPHVILGSIQTHTEGIHKNRRTVESACQNKGCKNKRRVATSDLWQVKFCQACTEIRQRERRKK
jgi:hypothetical protein